LEPRKGIAHTALNLEQLSELYEDKTLRLNYLKYDKKEKGWHLNSIQLFFYLIISTFLIQFNVGVTPPTIPRLLRLFNDLDNLNCIRGGTASGTQLKEFISRVEVQN